MGKIFTPTEIRNNRIPRREDFPRAKDIVFDGLSKLIRKGEVYGGKVFGSVGNGTPTERSDFDIVVITKGGYESHALDRLKHTLYRETHVSLEPQVINATLAEKGFHTIDTFFLDHIRNIPTQGNVIGENPTDIIVDRNVPPGIEYENYLEQKIRRFREGTEQYSDSNKYRTLQRVLESPVSIGRKTLQMYGFLGYPVTLGNDTKQEVSQAFKDTFDKTPIAEQFTQISEQNTDYSLLIRQLALGQLTLSSSMYHDYVNRMYADTLPIALRFTEDLALSYLTIKEGIRNKGENHEGRPHAPSKERL